MALKDEIEEALNRHSAENGSDTPDFILASYLSDCLAAFDRATNSREIWYGHAPPPHTREGAERWVIGAKGAMTSGGSASSTNMLLGQTVAAKDGMLAGVARALLAQTATHATERTHRDSSPASR